MNENDEAIENNLASEYDPISKDQIICSSFEKTNVEIYSKNEHWYYCVLTAAG